MYESLYKRISLEVGLIGLANLGSTLSSILILSILTKSLGVTGYGIYVQFFVTLALIASFVPLGLPVAAIRFIAGEKNRNQILDDIYSTFSIIILFSSFCALVLLFFSEGISRWLFDENKIFVYILSALIPIECIYWASINLFRAFQETQKFAAVSLLRTFIELTSIFFITLSGFGIIWILISLLFIRAAILVILILYLIRSIGFTYPRFSRIREYLRFGIPTVPGNMASWIVNSSDKYLIGILLGIAFVGYYSPGYSLGSAIIMLMVPFSFVLGSILPKYYEVGDMDLVRKIFNLSLKYFLILAVPTVLGISILSQPMLVFLTTESIANIGYQVTPFIAFGSLFYCVGSGFIGQSLYLYKKTKVLMFVWILASIINLFLNFILIPEIGIIGAAIATLIAYLLVFLLNIYFSNKYFKFSVNYGPILKIILSSLVMSVIVLHLYVVEAANIFLIVTIGIISYGLMLLCLGTLSNEEFNFFMNYYKIN
ncbi:MAG: polysaccharide biosynthesis C-terminal domain-containing protein [Methanotrichaceae archaeon]|nr:polysaccharide biosynthesis C-terminal domain-containing protein [Methanotrichaceae archaeon]